MMSEPAGSEQSTWVDALGRRSRHAWTWLQQLAQHAGRAFADDRGTQIAAALTYHTVFSLLPTMALALVVLKIFLGPSEIAAFKDTIVNFVADWLSADLRVEAPVDSATLDAGSSLARERRYGEVLAQLDENVAALLDELQAIDFQRIGAVGVLLFIYAATGLLSTVEQSFNQIYDAPSGRPIYRRIPLYYTTLTLAPLVILAGQVMQSRLLAGIQTISWTDWLTRPVAAALPLVTTWGVFTLMYVLIPNARVNLRAAATAAALAAIVWVAVLEGFSVYVGNYAAASLYGALALVPLALLWVWLAWIIVLVGLEMSRSLQLRPWRGDPAAAPALIEKGRPAPYDARWLMLLVAAIVERFERGDLASAPELAADLGLADHRVADMLRVLEAEGLVRRVSSGQADGPDEYVLGRAPAQLELNALLDLAEGRTVGELEDGFPGGQVLERLVRARRELLAGVTAATLAGGARTQAAADERR